MDSYSRIAFTDGTILITEPVLRIETDDPELIIMYCQDGSLVAVRRELLKYVISDNKTTQNC